MTSKILTGAAAFTLATTAGLVTTAPASAQYAQWSPGDAAADIVGGVVGGAVAAATFPFWATTGYYGYYDRYYPGYAYTPGYVYEPRYAYAPGYGYAYIPEYGYGYYSLYGSRYRHYRGGPHPR
jgi:hypothetical protein